MLTLPDHPLIDKHGLVGGCVRLRLRADLPRLRAEVQALPADCWGSRGGRVGVHNPAQAIFLRGYAPAEGELPIEDRPVLGALPYIRELITTGGLSLPMRCLLASLPPGQRIAPHIDRADYFAKTIRLHVPIVTSEKVAMYGAGRFYRMAEGEVWALNNSDVHGVINATEDLFRIHLICDFLPTPPLLELIRAGERNLGFIDRAMESALEGRPAG